MRALFFSFAVSLDERIKFQPVRSRLAPQERCAQLSCASKPGGFMQPSGARGAHGFLVRPRVTWRKRKEGQNVAGPIPRILSRLTCGFLGRRSDLRAAFHFAHRADSLEVFVGGQGEDWESELTGSARSQKKRTARYARRSEQDRERKLLDEKSFPELVAPYE
jgi:hypothetical protein